MTGLPRSRPQRAVEGKLASPQEGQTKTLSRALHIPASVKFADESLTRCF